MAEPANPNCVRNCDHECNAGLFLGFCERSSPRDDFAIYLDGNKLEPKKIKPYSIRTLRNEDTALDDSEWLVPARPM